MGACPVVEVAAGLSRSSIAECEDEFRCAESLSFFKGVLRCVRIDAADDAQVPHVVFFECKTEIASPSECAGEYGAGLFLCGDIECQLEERRNKHVGTRPEFCVEHFLTVGEPLFAEVGFVGPVSVKLCEIIFGIIEMKHGRSVFFYFHGLRFAIGYFRPEFEYVFLYISHVMEFHFGLVYRIGHCNDCFLHALRGSAGGVAHVGKQRRLVSVGMVYVECRFIIVFHAMCQISLRPLWQSGIICFIQQLPSQIFLMETTVAIYHEHHACLVRCDDNGFDLSLYT